jgi:hypothetical protein
MTMVDRGSAPGWWWIRSRVARQTEQRPSATDCAQLAQTKCSQHTRRPLPARPAGDRSLQHA